MNRPTPTRIEIYEATDGHRWRLIARNGRIVADGAEAYSSLGNAKRAVYAAYRHMAKAEIVVNDTPPRKWKTP